MSTLSKASRCVATLIVLMTLSGSARAQGERNNVSMSKEACTRMAVDYTRFPDARTQIYGATVRDAAGEIPAYCELRGYIAPHQQIELRLPVHWNES
jgi:hypothetical protein